MSVLFSIANLTTTYWCMRKPATLKQVKNLPVGLDGLSCEKFEQKIELHLKEIARKIENKTYAFAPLLELEKSKSNGGVRRLFIPRLRDQIVLKVLHNAIIDSAKEKGILLYQRTPYEVVNHFDNQVNQYQNPWILRTDITSFYDSIPRKKLLDLFDSLNPDPLVSYLLHEWSLQLKTRKGFSWGKVTETTFEGLPQGLSISTPLSELWATQIDKKYQNNPNYFRYVDDITLICTSKEAAVLELENLQNIVHNLGLKLSPSKTVISPLSSGIEWLGMKHFDSKKEVNPDKIKNWLKPFSRLKREAIVAIAEAEGEDKRLLLNRYIKKIEKQINGKYANRIRWYSLGEDHGQWKYADKLIHEMIRSVCRVAGIEISTIKKLPSVHASITKYKKIRSHQNAV